VTLEPILHVFFLLFGSAELSPHFVYFLLAHFLLHWGSV